MMAAALMSFMRLGKALPSRHQGIGASFASAAVSRSVRTSVRTCLESSQSCLQLLFGFGVLYGQLAPADIKQSHAMGSKTAPPLSQEVQEKNPLAWLHMQTFLKTTELNGTMRASDVKNALQQLTGEAKRSSDSATDTLKR
jgi:hypothetical protein